MKFRQKTEVVARSAVSMAFTIISPERAIMTPIVEYSMFRLAVCMPVSSPAAMIYWIPEMTKEITAKIPKIPKSQFMRLLRTPLMSPAGSPVSVGIYTPLPEAKTQLAVTIPPRTKAVKKNIVSFLMLCEIPKTKLKYRRPSQKCRGGLDND